MTGRCLYRNKTVSLNAASVLMFLSVLTGFDSPVADAASLTDTSSVIAAQDEQEQDDASRLDDVETDRLRTKSAQETVRASATDEGASSDGWSGRHRTADRSAGDPGSASTDTPTRGARWMKKTSPRLWTATSQKSGTPAIEFLNGKGSAQASSGSADLSTESPRIPQSSAQPRRASANFTQMNSTPEPVKTEQRPLTATERFKRALAEQRRAMAAQTKTLDEDQSVSVDMEDEPADGARPRSSSQDSSAHSGSADSLLGLTESESDDLESEDPLRRQKAESFLRLKMKILQLKSRQKSSSSSVVESPAQQTPAEQNSEVPPDAVQSDSLIYQNEGERERNAAEDEMSSDDSSAEQPATVEQGALTDSDLNRDESNDVEHPQDADSESGASAVEDVQAMPSQQAVVSGPIDRLGLANNLYAVGEYLLAMEMYEQADENQLTAQQQMWAEYQTANCLRRIGRTGEASNRYRRLAGQPEAGWLSEKAGWWVGVLEQIRQLEKSLEESSEQLPPPEPVSGLGLPTPTDIQEPVQP